MENGVSPSDAAHAALIEGALSHDGLPPRSLFARAVGLELKLGELG